MKFPTLLFSLGALYVPRVLSVAIHAWPDLPEGKEISSFQTDLMSLPSYSPDQTYWAAIAWNNGHMGMQTEANKRVFLFSLWDNAKGNLTVMEACPECVTSHFAHGVHIQYFYPWSDGVNYGYRVDYEIDGDYLIYTAQLRIDHEWMVFGKLRVINHELNGPGYYYQFLENPESATLSDARVGVWSNQCYRIDGDDACHPSLSACTSYTKSEEVRSWGAGLNKDANALWMAIDESAENSYAKQWECFKYDEKHLQHLNNSDTTTTSYTNVHKANTTLNTTRIHREVQAHSTALTQGQKATHIHSASQKKSKSYTWNLFLLDNMNASCFCAPTSSETSPVYMSQFMDAYENQRSYWDTAAYTTGSHEELIYTGWNNSSKCVAYFDVGRPLDAGQRISEIFLECFKATEYKTNNNNSLISPECWVYANSEAVKTVVQVS